MEKALKSLRISTASFEILPIHSLKVLLIQRNAEVERIKKINMEIMTSLFLSITSSHFL